MKKIGIFTTFLLLAFIAQAELVDDFDSYDLGNINDVTTNWVGSLDGGGGPALCTITVDSMDSSNQVIQLTEGGGAGQQWVRGTLTPTAAIDVDGTSTLYFRAKATSTVDSSFGLTDLDTAGANWGDFRVQFVFHNAMQIRDGGNVRNLAYAATGTAVPWNTDWYNIWLVVTNSTSAPVVKVYINQTGADATEGDRCVRADLLTQDTFAFRTAAAGALDNIFWRAQNNAADRMVQIDDIHITSGTDLSVPSSLRPYGPEVVQGTPSGTNIPTTLKWNAGADPSGIYAVNPDIVDQYVFMSGGVVTDPNLYYVGNTNADPGTDDPASEYTLNRNFDKTYYWAVVQAIDGYTQAFSTGDPISLVDPNNIIGPTWSYESLRSAPTITQQPADVRVFVTDPAASFTIGFNSVNPVTTTWYKDDIALTGDETDVTITTDAFTYSTLTIDTPELSDEGKYYCILSVEEEGTDDDIQSVTRLLVIKKLLAQFDFEQNLDDSSPNGAPSGIVKTVSLADPNEMLATVVASPAYISNGIEGYAISLNGTEYIDLGVEGYPKAGPLNTLGDARGEGYEKRGFGRGMDEGSILCWVRLASSGVIYSNANIADGTHFALTTNGTTNARIIVRGENWNGGWQNLGEANGAYQMQDFNLQNDQWHMFAATWNDSTARIYINGEQVASNTQGFTEVYFPWDLSNIIGASRQGQPNRHLLNPNDFVTGAVDSLRVYNYVISADVIAQEYQAKNELGLSPCANHTFAGSDYNFDNTVSSYCKVDLADFAVIAENWLTSGLYTP
jgi:hypothetical protein